MDTDIITGSHIFELVSRKRALNHPTSIKFDHEQWQSALQQISSPNQRDKDLTFAAINFGAALRSLRQQKPIILFNTIDEDLTAIVQAANLQFFHVSRTFNNRLPSSELANHIDMIQHATITNDGGQEITADAQITALIDSVPIWLHEAKQRRGIALKEAGLATEDAIRSNLMRASIERGYRHLWQQALWNDYVLSKNEDKYVFAPRERRVEESWFAWQHRWETMQAKELLDNVGISNLIGKINFAAFEPVNQRRVSQIWKLGDRFRLSVKGVKQSDSVHRSHRMMLTSLEKSYVGIFLDEVLPALGEFEVSCRDIIRVWTVFEDICNCLRSHYSRPIPKVVSNNSVLSLTFSRAHIVQTVSLCTGLSKEKVKIIVDFITADLSDDSRIFQSGLFDAPLIPMQKGKDILIVAPPVLVGSPIKRVERWMERGGLSERDGQVGRGLPFEALVRSELSNALGSNEIISNWSVHARSFNLPYGGEEIDLLFRVDSHLFVCEIKCLLVPMEPIERFNLYSNLQRAASQANRKAEWCRENIEQIRSLQGFSEVIGGESIVPIVVINHGFGMGQYGNGVFVVDLHYIRLLLSGGSYQGLTSYSRDGDYKYHLEKMYGSQRQFIETISENLGSPKVLKRFAGAVSWRPVPYPAPSPLPFFVEMPYFVRAPVDEAIGSIFSERADSRKS